MQYSSLDYFFISFERYDLWASLWLTAWVIVGYFLTAFVFYTFFRRAAFCKYVCPLGQFNFLGSLISLTEIKIRQPKDCISGNKITQQRGCDPTRTVGYHSGGGWWIGSGWCLFYRAGYTRSKQYLSAPDRYPFPDFGLCDWGLFLAAIWSGALVLFIRKTWRVRWE